MNKKILVAICLCFCYSLFGQNIDQSVVVSNDYIVEFNDFKREDIKPTLADSLYKFDYSFDYSVFDSPYKGAFDFSPYEVQMTPGAMPVVSNDFYLRAGAGLSLYPELDLVYVPVKTKNFKLIVSDDLSGHYGVFSATPEDRGNYEATNGYYLFHNFKLATITDFKTSRLNFDALVSNRYGKTSTSYTHLNMIGCNFSFASNPKSKVEYSLKANYKYGFIDVPNKSVSTGVFSINGHIVPLKLGVHQLVLDAEYKNGGPNYIFFLNPSCRIVTDQFSLSVGVKIDDSFLVPSTTVITINPKVDFRLSLVKNRFNFFAGVTGGQGLFSSFGSFMKSPLYENLPSGLYYKERISFKAGFDGRIFQNLDYKLEAGFRSLKDYPIEGLRTLVIQDIDITYGKANFEWRTKRFSLSSEFIFNYATIKGELSDAYTPSKYEASIGMNYNWLNRIYAGINLQGASSRKNISGIYSDVPAYLDLGLNTEYKFSSKMSFWLNSGNLLGMSIERMPGIIEKSPYFTLGFSLVL